MWIIIRIDRSAGFQGLSVVLWRLGGFAPVCAGMYYACKCSNCSAPTLVPSPGMRHANSQLFLLWRTTKNTRSFHMGRQAQTVASYPGLLPPGNSHDVPTASPDCARKDLQDFSARRYAHGFTFPDP